MDPRPGRLQDGAWIVEDGGVDDGDHGRGAGLREGVAGRGRAGLEAVGTGVPADTRSEPRGCDPASFTWWETSAAGGGTTSVDMAGAV